MIIRQKRYNGRLLYEFLIVGRGLLSNGSKRHKQGSNKKIKLFQEWNNYFFYFMGKAP
jgi:hypothetical protein